MVRNNLKKILAEFNLTENEALKCFQKLGINEGSFSDVPDDMYEEIITVHKTLQSYIIPIEDVLGRSFEVIPFKKDPRIYFLVSGDTVVYVGQTRNLGMRISSHLQDKDFERVATFKVSRGEINERETVNITAHNPVYNKAYQCPYEYFNMVLANGVFR